MLNSSVIDFTEKLSSKAPVPGGGGASALCGAMGVALGHMVGTLTVGKKKYADVEEEVLALMDRAEELRVKLLKAVEDDAKAFEPLSKAYGIPKDDPTRDEVMEKCLKDAMAAPFNIMELSCEVINLQKEFADKGSVIAISDAATGVALASAALKGAAVNVIVNTRLMKDREYAKSIDEKVNAMLDEYLDVADEVYESVWKRLEK